MIEVEGLDRRATLAGAESCLVTVMAAEAEQLVLAAHWADLHHPDSLPPAMTEQEACRRRWDQECGVQPGGEGTPPVLASCFAELGMVLQSSAGGAKHLVADALDLRHRLPRVWGEVQAGSVRGWKARKVAQATRHLSASVAAEVDAALAGMIATLPWSRFERVLDATLMRADPTGAAHREAEGRSGRFVGLARPDPIRDVAGLKTLIARGEVLDILTFLAAVNRVADLLAVEGDADSIGVRRSKAVGILGQPDRALALLGRHQHDHGEISHADDTDRGADADEVEPTELQEPDESGTRSIDLSRPVSSRTQPITSVRVQLYVHLTDAVLTVTDPGAVCRVEGVGPVTAATVRRWLRRSDVAITVRPVVVPGRAVPVDGYEIPRSTRDAVLLRQPASVFPWSWCTERTSLQLDHIHAYLDRRRGGPPGQTAPDNLAPLVGPEHQRKTSGRWRTRSPAPGVHLWRSPHGWIELVTNQGTFPLGTTDTAERLWQAAATDVSRLEAVA